MYHLIPPIPSKFSKVSLYTITCFWKYFIHTWLIYHDAIFRQCTNLPRVLPHGTDLMCSTFKQREDVTTRQCKTWVSHPISHVEHTSRANMAHRAWKHSPRVWQRHTGTRTHGSQILEPWKHFPYPSQLHPVSRRHHVWKTAISLTQAHTRDRFHMWSAHRTYALEIIKLWWLGHLNEFHKRYVHTDFYTLLDVSSVKIGHCKGNMN